MTLHDFFNAVLALAMIGCVLSLPVGIVISFRKADREWKEQRALDLKWEENEKAKPRYVVKFIADGFIKSTGPCDPWQSNPGSNWNVQRTSESLANSLMENSHTRGYFRDETNMTYPSCNIRSAWIEETK